MDINRLTEKAQEALRAAQSEATRQGHHRRIFSAQCKPFSDTKEQRKPNSQHRKDDMEN